LIRFQKNALHTLELALCIPFPYCPGTERWAILVCYKWILTRENQPQFFMDVRWFWTKLCNLTYNVILPVAIYIYIFLFIYLFIYYFLKFIFSTKEQTHLRGYWRNFGRWPAFWGSSSGLAPEIYATWLLPVFFFFSIWHMLPSWLLGGPSGW
jgi:hypothetical protein